MTPQQADAIGRAQIAKHGHHYIDPGHRLSFCGRQVPKPLYGGFYGLFDFTAEASPVRDSCPACWKQYAARLAHLRAGHVTSKEICEGDTFCSGCGKDWIEEP